MKTEDIILFLNRKFPLNIQEKYDNAGEQLSFRKEDIRNIMISLDLDNNVIDEAFKNGCNLIITHHPFFFKPVRSLITGDPKSEILFRLIQGKISLYAAHTNLDKIYYDKLSGILGIIKKEILIKSYDDLPDVGETGFGIYGELEKYMKLGEFLDFVKKRLKLDFIVFSGDKSRKIKKIAVANGSGGNYIEKVLREKELDCFLTGDVGYHNSVYALSYDVALIDAGHFGTERVLLNFLKDDLEERLEEKGVSANIQVFISHNEKNPFQMFY